MKQTIKLTQGELRNMISESVKRILRETWYPEEDDMMDDYYFGMMVKVELQGNFDDMSEEAKQNLLNANEEYVQYDGYCSVMVTNVNVVDDNDIIIEAAVSAPDMPIDAIEEDVQDKLWYWFEDKTGLRAIRFDFVEERVVFDRRSEKYK